MVQLEPSDEVWNAMFTYVEQFRLRVQQAGEMDDSVYTGDVYSDFVIHRKEQFQWLNGEIGRHMRLYLQELGVDITDLEIYAQKSLPTVCNRKKGEVDEHTHENAHFSCVYYLSVDESNYTGNLYFRNPNSLKVNKVPVPITKANSITEKFHQVIPETASCSYSRPTCRILYRSTTGMITGIRFHTTSPSPPGRRSARMNIRSHITVSGHRWLMLRRTPASILERDE